MMIRVPQERKDFAAAGAVVVTPHPSTGAAGLEMFNAGGNAVDAAVAAMLAICVVQPYQVGLGGYGGSVVVYRADGGGASAIEFDSRAPLGFTVDPYLERPERALHGAMAVSVPGVVAGLDLALREWGTKKWREAAAPARVLAEDGFVVDLTLRKTFDTLTKASEKTAMPALFPDGNIPRVGDRWAQKDLARLLARLEDDPRAFYEGEIPNAIAKQVKAQGGILAEEDFAAYKARVVEPLAVEYRGHRMYTPPPPSGGLTSLAILQTLESFEIPRYQRWGAPYFDLFVEAAKLCWEERRRHLGDPDFVRAPFDRLLSKPVAAARAERIKNGRGPKTRPSPPSAGNHTVNIVAIDRQRNLVSLTATQGDTFGSRVGIPGLGLVLGHGMSRFTFPKEDPRSPNAPEPGKRMLHNMCPTVVIKDGRPWAAIGLPGGTKIVNVTAQLAASVIDFAATATEAVYAPRVHTEGGEPLLLSATTPAEVAGELELMGHKVSRGQAVGGAANVVLVASEGKGLTAACSVGPGGIGGL
jgi:gamma-glutamyltranspeptidase/glutathione hydrolase